MSFSSIHLNPEWVEVLDQLKLPHQEDYLRTSSYQELAQAIREMKIRGAPAIGVAAACAQYLALKEMLVRGDFEPAKWQEICNFILDTRPTAVNLVWALDCVNQFIHQHLNVPKEELLKKVYQFVDSLLKQDIQTNQRIAANGIKLIDHDSKILTYCNTGALATAGVGTALGVIAKANQHKKGIYVYACETRPYLQGARLTAWELKKLKVPFSLIADNMAGYFMQKQRVDLVIVGADRIAANFDVANKIGTYTLAVLAKAHKIPFYVAAPKSTFDAKIATGADIPIEQRAQNELTTIAGKSIAPDEIQVENPAFDVTPADLISGIITDEGLYLKDEITHQWQKQDPDSTKRSAA